MDRSALAHLWTTLRNLGRLLRRLDDHEHADLLDAAPRRAAALAAARRAIDTHLGAS